MFLCHAQRMPEHPLFDELKIVDRDMEADRAFDRRVGFEIAQSRPEEAERLSDARGRSRVRPPVILTHCCRRRGPARRRLRDRVWWCVGRYGALRTLPDACAT